MKTRRVSLRASFLCGLVALVAIPVAPSAAFAQADSTFAKSLAEVRQLTDQARYAAADSLARASLEGAVKTRGAESLEAADFMVQIVLIAWRAGKDKDPAVRALADHALLIREKKLPPDDVQIAGALRAQGFAVLHTQGAAAAIPIFRRALEIRKAAQGTENADYAAALVDLGTPYYDADRREFRRLNEEAAAILARVAADGKQRGAVLTNLGAAAMDEGDYAKALQFSEDAVRVKLKAWGPDHPRLLVSMANVAQVRRTLGDNVGALGVLEQVERSQTKKLGPYHPELMATLQNIAELHVSSGIL